MRSYRSSWRPSIYSYLYIGTNLDRKDILMSYVATVIKDNPIAYWRLNESYGNFLDSSGNGYTLIPHGGVTYAQSALAFGLEQCVSFDGSTAYALTNSIAPATPPFTIEVWMRSPPSIAAGPYCFASTGQPNNGWGAQIDSSANSNHWLFTSWGIANYDFTN